MQVLAEVVVLVWRSSQMEPSGSGVMALLASFAERAEIIAIFPFKLLPFLMLLMLLLVITIV